MTMVEEKVRKLAEIADLSLRGMRIGTALHAFFSIGFGSSLVLSGILERYGRVPSYEFLIALPYWPYSVGAVYILAGVLIFASAVPRRYEMTHFCLQGVGFTIEALMSAVYASLFAYGTFLAGDSLIGPQWLYAFVAASASVRAYFAWRAIQVVRRTGE